MYKYQPTRNGFSCTMSVDDARRTIIRPLYPECEKNLVYTDEECKKLELHQLRVLICAKLAPRYMLDMHALAGAAGYGRFAVCTEKGIRFADEFEYVDAQYVDGCMIYTVRDAIIGEGELKIEFVPTFGMVALSVKISRINVPSETKIYFIHGGMTAWNPHGPTDPGYTVNACAGNMTEFEGDVACLSLTDDYHGMEPLTAPRPQANSAWLLLDSWKICVYAKATGAKWFNAAPEALLAFNEALLSKAEPAFNCVLCALLPNTEENDLVIGRGHALNGCDPSEVYQISKEKNSALAQRFTVDSDELLLDSVVHTASYATEAMFGGSVFTHGVFSWRDGYLGWRNAYGPLAYGMLEKVRRHFNTHFQYSRITEGPDAGALMHQLEDARPDATTFYTMYETFLHQARRYYEYTADESFAKAFAPVLDGCIQRSIRRLKPGQEWLFENVLNTWISDSHWSRMGQCTQSSAYTYDMMRMASEIMPTEEQRAKYADIAQKIKEDAHRLLWLKRKGIFAYCRDLEGNKLMHEAPELSDIYHSSEMDLADKWEIYQMLDWAEANLRQQRADNGGRLFWSSDWHPNSGDTYTHSTYEVILAEQMNFAMIYQKLGLCEQGYEIFKSVYTTMYGGEKCNVWDHDDDKYIAANNPPKIEEVAGGLPGSIHENATSRRCMEFSDAISMFGREVYEGILGIKPERNHGKFTISPSLPSDINHIRVHSEQADYEYEREDDGVRLTYTVHHSDEKTCELHIRFAMPVGKVLRVEGGTYETEMGFGVIFVNVIADKPAQGSVKVFYAPSDVLPVEPRRTVQQGDVLKLSYKGEKVLKVNDPQGLLTDALVAEDGSFSAAVTASVGSGVFFLIMDGGYIRPVKLMVEGETDVHSFIRLNAFEDPKFVTVDMDELFNAASPMEVLKNVQDNVPMPAYSYNHVNTLYYRAHLVEHNKTIATRLVSDERWRSMVNEDSIAMTGEGIPFRSKKEGNYLAATVVQNCAYPDRITKAIHEKGRALYMMVTGTTFPMQSHVENLRVTLKYSDGTEEVKPLINPFDICDGWANVWARFHDSPGSGFENLRGQEGALTSAGMDLTKPIATDTEASILCFPLNPEKELASVEFRMIALDAVFCLMGMTIVK